MWLISFLCWLVISFSLAALLKKIAQKERLSPLFCWAALILPCAIFLPNFDVFKVTEVNFIWLNSSAQQQMQFVGEVAKQTTSQNGFNINWLLFGGLFIPSAYRLMRLTKRYRNAKALIATGTPYHLSTVPCMVMPMNQSPFVIGFHKPTLVLPQYFMHLSKQQQGIILAHEEMHIANRDHFHTWLWLVLVEICWFNPAIKRLSELYVNAMEQRCDLQTISRHRYTPQDYANTLLLSIKLSQQGALNPFAAHFTGQTIKVADYKQRFTFIFSHAPVQIKKSLYVFSCALLIVVLAKGAISQVYAGQDKWQYPVANIDISSHYGHVTSFRKNRPHRGIDLVDAKGTSIVAAKTGKVIIADNKTMAAAFGNTIVIQHSNGWQSLYAHLDEISVTQGQWVKSGELIGKMGDSGKVTGTHLHFELAKDGQTVDPLIYLNEK